jgi:transcription initiation factor TFIIE subunit alpha
MIPGINQGGSLTNKSQFNDAQITMEVPNDLKTLIRLIMRAFYGFELYLCMEMLIHHRCIKTEDLADLLRIDNKLVHQHLQNLKREKFVNERMMIMEFEGKQSKCSYFYVNYKMVVNVIKYKIDRIRIQIESEEKQCTSRANFKCTNCQKTYSDLDTKDIFDLMTCRYCNGEVEEDVSTLPNRSSRNLLAKFNTQMECIFQLLSKVESIRLADDLLMPEPCDLTHVLEKLNSNSNYNQNGQNSTSAKTNGVNVRSNMVKFDVNGKWSGDKTRNTDLMGQTRISINFDSTDGSSSLNVRPKKELPAILLSNRTNEDQYDTGSRESQLLNSLKNAADATLSHNRNEPAHVQPNSELTLNSANASNRQSASVTPNSSINLETIIMQKLLIHEKKNTESLVHTNGDSMNGIQTKKRDFEATKKLNKTGLFMDDKNNVSKKRKLNNGTLLSYKSYSDGSDRELDEQDDESNSYYTDNNSNTMNINDNDESSNNNELDYDPYVPIVSVQNKCYRLDKLNTYLINLMNESEKEHYIDICRQLYTEIYEI